MANDIVVTKKILFQPDTLEINLKVRAYFIPKIENLPEVFKPYIINMAINMFAKKKVFERRT